MDMSSNMTRIGQVVSDLSKKNQAKRQAVVADPTNPASPMYQEQMRIDLYRQQRNRDLAAGQKRGAEIFAPGALGRLNIDDILTQRRAQANGFTPEEQNAMRDQNISSVDQATGAANRQARIQMAAEGVRGNRAVAATQKMQTDASGQKAGLERDLFLKNIDARRTGLDAYQGATVDAQKYNTDQTNKELQGRLTTEMGYGALGAADRGAAVQAIVGQQQADAAARSGGGGGKK